MHRDVYLRIAKLHKEELNQSFIGTLKIETIALFYEALDSSKSNFLIFSESDNRINGFVAIGSSMFEVYKYIIFRPLKLFKDFPINIFRFSVFKGIFESFHHNLSQHSNKDLPKSELYHIAVHQDKKGSGLAKELFMESCKVFKKNNINIFRINVGKRLLRAQSFYEKLGCKRISETTIHGSEESITYIYNIDNESKIN